MKHFLLCFLLSTSQSWAQTVRHGDCAVIVASRQSLGEAKKFISENPSMRVQRVYRASNGWLAISTGTIADQGSTKEIDRLKAQGLLPSDAYCSNGRSYKGVVWSASKNEPAPVFEKREFFSLFEDVQPRLLSWDDKRFLQAALAFEGAYSGLLDGDWGRLSQVAMSKWSLEEYGTQSENWHLALLAYSLFQRIEADGWEMQYYDGLNMSFLVPEKALNRAKDSDLFLNFNHSKSSLSFSIGILGQNDAEAIHNYTLGTHSVPSDPYTVRKNGLAVSSVTQPGGSKLYTRSDYVDGNWSTVMVSAHERDEGLLNAVTSSISIGKATPLRLTNGGQLERVIIETIAFATDDDETSTAKDTPDSEPFSQHERTANKNRQGSGSGFFISSDGHLLTNAHVVDGCKEIVVAEKVATLIDTSAEFDLALLYVPDANVAGVASFANTPAGLNADVTAVGYPYSGLLGGINVTRGSVSANKGWLGDATRMQITAPVQSGNSGGPLLGSDGAVVGVVVSKLNALEVADATGDLPQNVNYAVRGEIAKLFIAQNGLSPIVQQNSSSIQPEELAKIASDFTAFVECR